MARPTLCIIAAATVAAISGPACAGKPGATQELQTRLVGRVAGEPVQCINLALANNSEIIDGTAIIYRVGQTLYVNEPQNAQVLRRDDLLETSTSGTQLCRIYAIRVYDRTGGFQKGIVTLGSFVPYTKPNSSS